jgi:hypothetical protein
LAKSTVWETTGEIGISAVVAALQFKSKNPGYAPIKRDKWRSDEAA